MAILVFLDIDGVMVSPRGYAEQSGPHAPPEPQAIAALNEICSTLPAMIVLSSTWRFEGLAFIQEHLRGWGVTAPLIDCTCWPPKTTREEEILDWLENTHRDIDAFVILDDDGMDKLRNRAVQTNGKIGLTHRDAARAIQILQEQLL
jgi:hypothetical protein